MKKKMKNEEAAISEPGTEIKAVKPRKKRKKAPVIIAVLVVVFFIIRAVACSSGDNVGAVVTLPMRFGGISRRASVPAERSEARR